MNCPTVALIDGKFRSDLEETGMGFTREVEVLGAGRPHGLFTKAFCTSRLRKRWRWPRAGVDNIIVHFGNSSGGTIGSKTVLGATMRRCSAYGAILDALAAKYSGRIVTCHGGAIETPADFEQFLQREPRLHGYVGGSSAERFPIETRWRRRASGFRASGGRRRAEHGGGQGRGAGDARQQAGGGPLPVRQAACRRR